MYGKKINKIFLYPQHFALIFVFLLYFLSNGLFYFHIDSFFNSSNFSLNLFSKKVSKKLSPSFW